MKTIRNCVFETNSSSCHTVTIGTNTGNDMPNITIECRGTGEYGWDVDVRYDTPEQLLDYAMVAYAYICPDEATLKERMQEISECFARHGVTVDWCEDEYGKDHIYWSKDGHLGTEYTEGYIDHQSNPQDNVDCRAVADMVAGDCEALYNFVFGGDSYVITDNDNH
jgi:hypothetical protein